MMTDDWRDKLMGLRAEMPEADSPAEAEPATEPKASQKGRLDIIVERKGRGGKVATIITGFTIDDDEIDSVASRLKKVLGVGGSCRGGEILIQGDRAQAVSRALSDMDFKCRII